LLSGETITASKAIVSNLTVWDTYGKLVGLDHTPPEIRRRLKSLHSWGAYLIYTSVEESTATRLPADHLVALTQSVAGEALDPVAAQINLALAPSWDPRGPSGYRAATVHVFTEAEEWFVFHEDESENEAMDQAQLESIWQRLHQAVPELGAGIEVIDTSTPQSFYANTRRKLGMVGGVGQTLDVFGPHAISHRTHFPNLYLTSDTAFPGAGVAAVSHGALLVANEISGQH
jgi:phytoene dehydrogenase-like protein